MDCLWTTLPPIWAECVHSLIHHLIIFLCPQLIWILFVFLLRVRCIAPGGQLFEKCREMLMSFLSRIFANLIDILRVWAIFLVLESNLIFQQSFLFKSNCWNEIREMLVLKSIFGNQACLVKDPTHAIQWSPLIVLYFEDRNNLL